MRNITELRMVWVLAYLTHMQAPEYTTATKKADAMKGPQAFHRVGLLANKPPGHGRAALYLVVRQPDLTSIRKPRV